MEALRRNPSSSSWLLHTVLTPVLGATLAMSNNMSALSNKSRVSGGMAGGSRFDSFSAMVVPHASYLHFLPGLARDVTDTTAAVAANNVTPVVAVAVNNALETSSEQINAAVAFYEPMFNNALSALVSTIDNSSDLFTFNNSTDLNARVPGADGFKWLFLLLAIFVFFGVFGNVLVCVAVCTERRLQNATNFFLLSLAVADLLVSLLVMPIAIVNEFYGKCYCYPAPARGNDKLQASERKT